jgi:hypothetical protein
MFLGATFMVRPYPSGRIQIAAFRERCAMFVRNIDLALQRAEASYSRETWQVMSASERSAAIYRELQALDAQSTNDGSYIPTRSLRRRRRRGPPV